MTLPLKLDEGAKLETKTGVRVAVWKRIAFRDGSIRYRIKYRSGALSTKIWTRDELENDGVKLLTAEKEQKELVLT